MANAAFSSMIWDDVPSGKHTKNYGKIHHFQWVNPLFLWQFSIAMLNYQRVSITKCHQSEINNIFGSYSEGIPLY
jgi:hypothetical protein